MGFGRAPLSRIAQSPVDPQTISLKDLEERNLRGRLLGSRVVAPFEVANEAGRRVVTLWNGPVRTSLRERVSNSAVRGASAAQNAWQVSASSSSSSSQ